MSRDRFDVLDRFEPLFEAPEPSFERFVHRRDRKRRNQRVAAGVVGMTIFVAAVWTVMGSGLDRGRTPATPGETETGPIVTGPIVTGPIVTGPIVTGPAGSLDGGWDGEGLPPEGPVPSTPEEGKLIAYRAAIHVGQVFVYADGRAIWLPDAGGPILEQRLSPEGLELMRAKGYLTARDVIDRPHLPPPLAWAEPEPRLYVPSRYAVCVAEPGDLLTLLPEQAVELLRGTERTYENHPGVECFDVTTAEARSLASFFRQAERYYSSPAPVYRLKPRYGGPLITTFYPILPHGTWADRLKG
jgi:hypothetical protein